MVAMPKGSPCIPIELYIYIHTVEYILTTSDMRVNSEHAGYPENTTCRRVTLAGLRPFRNYTCSFSGRDERPVSISSRNHR